MLSQVLDQCVWDPQMSPWTIIIEKTYFDSQFISFCPVVSTIRKLFHHPWLFLCSVQHQTDSFYHTFSFSWLTLKDLGKKKLYKYGCKCTVLRKWNEKKKLQTRHLIEMGQHCVEASWYVSLISLPQWPLFTCVHREAFSSFKNLYS